MSNQSGVIVHQAVETAGALTVPLDIPEFTGGNLVVIVAAAANENDVSVTAAGVELGTVAAGSAGMFAQGLGGWSAASSGGGGVSPETVYEALLPLGEIDAGTNPYGAGVAGSSLFDPSSTDMLDAGWMTFSWSNGLDPPDDIPAAAVIFGLGDLSDDTATVVEVGQLTGGTVQPQSVLHIYRWNTSGEVEMFIDSTQAQIKAASTPAQVSPLFQLTHSDTFTIHTRIGPAGELGFFGTLPATQSVAGTTTADAIACLKRYGLMAA